MVATEGTGGCVLGCGFYVPWLKSPAKTQKALDNLIYYVFFFVVAICLFSCAGAWSQGLTHTIKMLYSWAIYITSLLWTIAFPGHLISLWGLEVKGLKQKLCFLELQVQSCASYEPRSTLCAACRAELPLKHPLRSSGSHKGLKTIWQNVSEVNKRSDSLTE